MHLIIHAEIGFNLASGFNYKNNPATTPTEIKSQAVVILTFTGRALDGVLPTCPVPVGMVVVRLVVIVVKEFSSTAVQSALLPSNEHLLSKLVPSPSWNLTSESDPPEITVTI